MKEPVRGVVDSVRISHCDPCIAVAEVGPLCVVIWRGAVTKTPFQRQSAGLASTVKGHPDGAAFLCVVEPTAKPPNDELRAASTQMVESHGARIRCVGVVIEGDGFLAAVHRGAITGMLMLARNRQTQISVFATVPEALAWMEKHLSLPSPVALTAAVEHVRSKIPAPPLPWSSSPRS